MNPIHIDQNLKDIWYFHLATTQNTLVHSSKEHVVKTALLKTHLHHSGMRHSYIFQKVNKSGIFSEVAEVGAFKKNVVHHLSSLLCVCLCVRGRFWVSDVLRQSEKKMMSGKCQCFPAPCEKGHHWSLDVGSFPPAH